MSTTMMSTDAQPQNMAALARANLVRLAAADLKRDIADGRLSVVDALLADDRAQPMKVFDLLRAQVRWGDERTKKLLTQHRLKETKRVRELTERQRLALAADLAH